MIRIILAIALYISLAIGSVQIAAAADIVIGVPNWSSAKATSYVLKHLIEKRFGLKVELKDGSNDEIFAGMDSGSIHIHPEAWLPNHAALHAKYVIRRKTVVMSDKAVPAAQGMCVTKQTSEEYNIKSIQDLTSPKVAGIFDTDGNGLGEVWIGATAWSSTNIERIRAKSYGYAKTMELLEAEEDVGMASIDVAAAIGKPQVFFCYQPHHVFELHDIVMLDEPATDPRKWNIVDAAKDPKWLEKSHAAVAYPQSFLHVTYSTKLKDKFPKVAAFLGAISLDVDTISAMTYALVVERRDPAEFSKQWVEENTKRVDKWAALAK